MAVDPKLCERIARRWCELMKMDPDESVRYFNDPTPDDPYVRTLSSPRWQRLASEVPAQLAWMLAIEDSV